MFLVSVVSFFVEYNRQIERKLKLLKIVHFSHSHQEQNTKQSVAVLLLAQAVNCWFGFNSLSLNFDFYEFLFWDEDTYLNF